MSKAEDFGNWLVVYGFDRWHSRTGLVSVLAGLLAGGIFVFAGIDITNVSVAEWAILFAISLIVWLLWLRTSIERAPRDRVGFGVAIEFEDSDQAKQLRADFVDTLKTLLDAPGRNHRFRFIEFPQSIAKRVQTHEQALWLLRKANLRFLIHGRARVRAIPKEQSHVLDLR